MDEIELNQIVVLSLVSIVLLGTFFGCYRLGRFIERREYTVAFVKQVKETYQQGYEDGFNRATLNNLLKGIVE